MTSSDGARKPPPLPLLLAVLTGGHLFGNCTVIAIAAIATDLKGELNIGAEDYGWLIGIYMIAQGIMAIPGGLLIDYIGARLVFTGSLLMAAIGTAVVAGATEFWIAFLGMFLVGSGYGLVNPCTSKTVFECFPPKGRATAMGIKQTGVPIGGVAGAMVAGTFVAQYGRSDVLYGFAIVISVASLTGLLIPSQTKRPQTNALSGMMTVLRDKNLQIFNTAIGIFQASMYAMLSNIAAFSREVLNADPAWASANLSIVQASSATGRLGWGALSDLIFAAKRKPVLLIIGSSGTLCLLTMALVSPNWPFFLVLALAVPTGLATAGYVGLTQTITVESADPALTATAVGSNRIFTSVGAGLGVPFFGWIVDHHGYTPAWIATALFFAIGTAVIAIGFKEKK
jgi:MFS transporter, ACS family, hexuronate transporter